MTTHLPLLPLVLSRVPPGLTLALEQAGAPYVSRGDGRARGAFVLFDSQSEKPPELAAGQRAIDVDHLRSAEDGDPFELLVSSQAARCMWQLGRLAVSEEVAAVNKSAVRRHLLARLRRAVEAAGGVWLTVSAFPFPYRSAFNFRIDYDEYHAEDFRHTLAALTGHEDASSHFVCGSAYESHPDALARLRGLDVGSHGYWHYTYRDFEDNLRNLSRGIDVLRARRIEPSGFVAPHGRFNVGLQRAMETLAITHSSEFGLAYDERPFFPLDSGVLQVPVHPVSLGLILESCGPLDDHSGQTRRLKRAIDAAVRHFTAVARIKHQLGEPMFFYGHPTRRLGRYPQVLKSVLQTAAELPAVWKTTLSRYSAWWRRRASIALKVYCNGENYTVTSDRPSLQLPAAVEFWRGDRLAVLPLDRDVIRFSPQSLGYVRRVSPTPLPPAARIDPPHRLREALLRSLDWERVTPTRDIRVRSWRTLVKKALRYVKG